METQATHTPSQAAHQPSTPHPNVNTVSQARNQSSSSASNAAAATTRSNLVDFTSSSVASRSDHTLPSQFPPNAQRSNIEQPKRSGDVSDTSRPTPAPRHSKQQQFPNNIGLSQSYANPNAPSFLPPETTTTSTAASTAATTVSISNASPPKFTASARIADRIVPNTNPFACSSNTDRHTNAHDSRPQTAPKPALKQPKQTAQPGDTRAADVRPAQYHSPALDIHGDQRGRGSPTYGDRGIAHSETTDAFRDMRSSSTGRTARMQCSASWDANDSWGVGGPTSGTHQQDTGAHQYRDTGQEDYRDRGNAGRPNSDSSEGQYYQDVGRHNRDPGGQQFHDRDRDTGAHDSDGHGQHYRYRRSQTPQMPHGAPQDFSRRPGDQDRGRIGPGWERLNRQSSTSDDSLNRNSLGSPSTGQYPPSNSPHRGDSGYKSVQATHSSTLRQQPPRRTFFLLFSR